MKPSYKKKKKLFATKLLCYKARLQQENTFYDFFHHKYFIMDTECKKKKKNFLKFERRYNSAVN